ncbi:MAG: helix-turn-helix transcriptional regulator [Cetobacterium sp.]
MNCVLEHIKKTRMNKGIMQKDIAKMINVSKSAYNSKENGNQKIRISEVLELFKILDIKMYLNNIEINEKVDILNIFKEQREQKGYTQDNVYSKVGFKCKQSYCNKENNKTTLYLNEFISICSVLSIDINFNVPYFAKVTSNKKVDDRNKKVICTTTGKVYDTIKEAAEKTGANHTLITKVCKGQRVSAGKLPTGEKLTWRYVDGV